MVEEIDKGIKRGLGKVAQYAPWVFAVTIVIGVVIAASQSAGPNQVTYPVDTNTQEFWEQEAKLRVEIDRNLEETAKLLERLHMEMDREQYDADALLAQIKEKRQELRELTDRLVNLRRRMAITGCCGVEIACSS
jgi:hypothetical protein